MTERDTAPQRLGALLDDVVTGFGLLSRLPVPTRRFSGAESVWVWPLVGVVVSGLSVLVAMGGLYFGLPAQIGAAMAMAVSALATGAMHDDGLADTFDGLFGGWTRERRLEIMKDSRIGSYGVLALMITGVARWSALSGLLALGHWQAMIAAAALSRAPMAALMAVMPNARQSGLSANTGRPPKGRVLICCGAAVMIAALTGCSGLVVMTLSVTLATLAVAWLAKARIGGQTGDILGATQSLGELAALCAALAHLS